MKGQVTGLAGQETVCIPQEMGSVRRPSRLRGMGLYECASFGPVQRPSRQRVMVGRMKIAKGGSGGRWVRL